MFHASVVHYAMRLSKQVSGIGRMKAWFTLAHSTRASVTCFVQALVWVHVSRSRFVWSIALDVQNLQPPCSWHKSNITCSCSVVHRERIMRGIHVALRWIPMVHIMLFPLISVQARHIIGGDFLQPGFRGSEWMYILFTTNPCQGDRPNLDFFKVRSCVRFIRIHCSYFT